MKIAVLKISGKSLETFFDSNRWETPLKKLRMVYDGIVIVHGAGKNITEWSKALGHEVKFINGQRVTSKEVMDVVAAVQSGLLNSKIVSKLNSIGIKAIGLTGIDRGSFVAKIIDKNLGYVGIPELVKPIDWIYDLLNEKVVPVFSSICRDKEGNLINVNADIFTEVLSTSLKAESVFFLSDINGVIINGAVQKYINEREIIEGISNGEITEGMIPKLNSCVELLNKGIKKVWIGSTNLESIFESVSNDQQVGTWIVQSS
ncbi:acetylglutamate kinase [Melioribacteraceae bacterium 4301-Me]|uniref:acetylglutamate kinase n=1 Tax=Pyranulibacter aquaticus TaxID=3163344 RepID=UPI00359AC643